MRKFTWLICLFVIFSSCKILKVAETRNVSNTKQIGIDVMFDAKATNEYSKEVEASINNVIQKFNNEHHLFSVHRKTANDDTYLTLNVSKIKIVSNGGAAVGYAVSAIGLIAAPIVTLQLSEQTFLLGFWYFPANKITYQGSLSPSLDNGKGTVQTFYAESGALFRSKEGRIVATKKTLNNFYITAFEELKSNLSHTNLIKISRFLGY